MSSVSGSLVCLQCGRQVADGQVRVSVARSSLGPVSAGWDFTDFGDRECWHVECFDPYGFLFALGLDELVLLSVGLVS